MGASTNAIRARRSLGPLRVHSGSSVDGGDPMSDSPATKIGRGVASWPGVTVEPHRFGGVEFRVGRRELGHLHGSRLADLPFPVKIREQLVAAGKAQPHHVMPESGWVSFYMRDTNDATAALALFRL